MDCKKQGSFAKHEWARCPNFGKKGFEALSKSQFLFR